MAVDAQHHSGETVERDLATTGGGGGGDSISPAWALSAGREHRPSLSRPPVFHEKAEIQVLCEIEILLLNVGSY